MEQKNVVTTQPAALPATSALISFDHPLRPQREAGTGYGLFHAECRYNADQILTAGTLFAKASFAATAILSVSCRTVIDGSWYSAEAVCAFAERALRQVLGLMAPEKMAVDAKACTVSCAVEYQYEQEVRIVSLFWIGQLLLARYIANFSGEVPRIYPPIKPPASAAMTPEATAPTP